MEANDSLKGAKMYQMPLTIYVSCLYNSERFDNFLRWTAATKNHMVHVKFLLEAMLITSR